MIHLDSFSGRAADLKPRERTSENVLRCLATHPRISTFDLSELQWLDRIVRDLLQRGLIVSSTEAGYPWLTYRLTLAGTEYINRDAE